MFKEVFHFQSFQFAITITSAIKAKACNFHDERTTPIFSVSQLDLFYYCATTLITPTVDKLCLPLSSPHQTISSCSDYK